MCSTDFYKTCHQTVFGCFFICRMYRMLQACLELIDGKGGLLSLLDDSQRFEAKEANQKFLSSFKQRFAPPGGSGGGGGRCVGAESDGYSHRCVSLPSHAQNMKRMIQRDVILNEYHVVVGCSIRDGECSTIDRGNNNVCDTARLFVPTVSFCLCRGSLVKPSSSFSIGSPARCARSDPYLPGTSTRSSCETGSTCSNLMWFEHLPTTFFACRPNKIRCSEVTYGPDSPVPQLRGVLPKPLSDTFYGSVMDR